MSLITNQKDKVDKDRELNNRSKELLLQDNVMEMYLTHTEKNLLLLKDLLEP